MLVVIDIDEDVRIAISRMGLLRIPDEMQKKVDKAIQHGTPLDNIRAKINYLPSYVAKFAGGSFAIHIDKEKVLHIIDKYTAESKQQESEG